MTTLDYYKMQKVRDENYDFLFVQTDTPGRVWDFQIIQTSQLYSDITKFELKFYPMNPVTSDGVMTISWTEDVEINEDVVCEISTYQVFDGSVYCDVDVDKKLITFDGIFAGVENYNDAITVILSEVRNPRTNQNLMPLTVLTYDDGSMLYKNDQVNAYPLLQCNYPCKRCSPDKDYCYECWMDDVNDHLMRIGAESTCKAECDSGYTKNGDLDGKVCIKCDDSCATCLDSTPTYEGQVGDAGECLTCAPGYDFRDYNEKCLQECPPGTFATENNRCELCSSNCKTCSGSADQCTSCYTESALPFLHLGECLETCPDFYGFSGGKCHECEYPCTTCSSGPQVCTSCSQERKQLFLYGPLCEETCPAGFITNYEEFQCEGCAPGCEVCDKVDQRICLQCKEGLMVHEGGCVTDCPRFFFANYAATECLPMSNIDIKLIYFPFLILTVIMFIVSWLGTKQKKKHLLIPNFLIFMGLIEHAALITQIVLNFNFGTFRYGACIMTFYGCYFAGNVAFHFIHLKNVALEDQLYNKWRNHPDHIWARRLMNILGFLISWKAYKLAYSSNFAIRLTPAKFMNASNYRKYMKNMVIYNLVTTYGGVIILNFVGVIDFDWGTQLYIMMIENMVISVIMIGCLIWETKKCETDYIIDYSRSKKSGKFNVMSVLDECDDDGGVEVSKTKEMLLAGNDKRNDIFITHKFEELVKDFGGRLARSFGGYDLLDKVPDPRKVQTWPTTSPQDEDRVLEPLPDPYPDNVIAIGLTQEQMEQMKYLSKGMPHKALQTDHFDADQNLRKDAMLVGHQRELLEVEKSMEKKKHRGRQNRYFKQIDNEDHDAGVLLGDDSEAEEKNLLAKNELLDAEATLEVQREQETEALKAEVKKKNRDEIKQKAAILTEENLKLKQRLEEQRTMDARESKDFQKKILEEEMRRQEILKNVEFKRLQREQKINSMKAQLAQDQKDRETELEESQKQFMDRLNYQADVARKKQEAFFNAQKKEMEDKYADQNYQKDLERKFTGKVDMQGSIQEKQEQARTVTPSYLQSDTTQNKAISSPIKGHAQDVRLDSQQTRDDNGAVNLNDTRSHMDKSVDDTSLKMEDLQGLKSQQDLLQQPLSPIPHPTDMSNTFDNTLRDVNDLFDRREFNEIDVLGEFDRDDRGNLVIPVDPKTKSKVTVDKKGRAINPNGYMIDIETGDVIHALTGRKMFGAGDLDEKGMIPMPYAIERFNFNPFEMLGTFFYDDLDDPLSFQKSQKRGEYFDELGRQVTLQGFMVDQSGNLIDKSGKRIFSAGQFKPYGGFMPKMYNYSGKTFEIQEIMGVFDRDGAGDVQKLQGKDDKGNDVFVDKAGFMVNERGYIINKEGHICTRQGRVLFLKSQLKNGEFPKIFPFTRFNISRVLGDYEMDPAGAPMLQKNAKGQFIDRKGRLVNAKGYLVDSSGNVIDIRGKLVFEKVLLYEDGDIPDVFRLNILRSDSASSLSRLMSEIDRNQFFDDSQAAMRRSVNKKGGASDTSFESMMDESPSKYDQQNQRYSLSSAPETGMFNYNRGARWAEGMPENIQEESDQDEREGDAKTRRRKKVATGGYIVEEITGRDIQMATAYGGVAKPRIRKVGARFANLIRLDRSGLQTSQANRPEKPKIHNLTTERVGTVESQVVSGALTGERAAKARLNSSKRVGTVGNTTDRTAPHTQGRSAQGARNYTASNFNEQNMNSSASNHDHEAKSIVEQNRIKKSAQEARKKKMKKDSIATSKNEGAAMPQYDRAFEDEFEKIYKKDIDKFIDGSDFEVESMGGFSEISKGTFKSAMQNNPKMKGLEKVYLQRLEFQNLGGREKPKQKAKPPAKREFMDRFNDDPRYIAKGEKLKFDLGTANTGGNSSGKKQQRATPQPPSGLMNDRQRSQSSVSKFAGQGDDPNSAANIQLHDSFNASMNLHKEESSPNKK